MTELNNDQHDATTPDTPAAEKRAAFNIRRDWWVIALGLAAIAAVVYAVIS